MLGGRFAITGSAYYGFLVWNLFLAWIPYLASLWLVNLNQQCEEKLKPQSIVVAVVWLLFVPNAPYILTDFIHIIVQPYPSGSAAGFLSGRPILWYDMILTASFAFIGHLLGLVSMTHIHRLVKKRYGPRWAWAVVLSAILLSGYGIYIGRFERLNSWDVFTNPLPALLTIVKGLVYLKGLLFSLAFAFFIFLTYLPVYVSSQES